MQMNRQPIRGAIKKERQVSTKEKYLEAEERYLNGEFTYDTHCLIQNLTEKGRLQPHMQGSFIQIAKILMLNELEILFLGATLEEMKWKIIDNCINPYIDDFKGLSEKIKSDTYNKKIQLSLLMIGHVVKLYLNDTDQISMFEYRIKQLMHKDYDKMYQEWVERMKKNFKFSPKNMNKLFREMDIIRTRKESQLDDVNYNSKVEELFKIFVEPDTKNEHRDHHQMVDDYEIEEQDLPLPVTINNMARTQSIKSLRSFGRRDSQRSQRDYGFGLRNMSSIFRNNSIDDQ